MLKTIRLRKGLDIKLAGSAVKELKGASEATLYALKPADFPGLVPRLLVKPGDTVKAGSPVFEDKKRPEIKFTSPVSGTIKSVDRGDRRLVLEVVIEKAGAEYVDFGKADPVELSRDSVKERLLQSGLWPSIKQRPYNIVANPVHSPKSVFISGFDTAPLAPDLNFVADNTPSELISAGMAAVRKLTDGKVNLVLDGRSAPSQKLASITGVEISYFSGPHPAGNPGIHIHHLDPINKGEEVWVVGLQDVIAIGRLFTEGTYKPERIIALAGSEVINTGYFRMLSGSSVTRIIEGNVREGNQRYISGNVLTGSRINKDGFLGYYDSQVTVIPEGDHFEFFGWAAPGLKKYSFSKTFLSSIFPVKEYRLDTNLNGGERAFVLTGQYEKVVPMDIYPMQLFKAILAEDIEMMENLGIYEVAEEDVALCEFICPSKTEIQSIVRKGLDLMVKEMQ